MLCKSLCNSLDFPFSVNLRLSPFFYFILPSLPFHSLAPKPDSYKYAYLFSPCEEQRCELTDTSGVVSAGGVSNSVCRT